MKSPKSATALSILCIVLALAILFIALFSRSIGHYFPSLGGEAKAALLGALIGSVLAFLLGRLNGMLDAVRERHKRHFHALVKLHAQLEEHRGIADDNLYLIENFQRVLREGNIYWSRMQELPQDKTHYVELHDLDLVRRLFSYNEDLRKINDDIRGVQNAYVAIQDARLNGSIDENTYRVNAASLADGLDAIAVFQQRFRDEKIVKMIVRVRLVMRKSDTPFMKLRRRLLKSTYPITDKEFNDELHVVEEESEATRQESRTEIQAAEAEILRRRQQNGNGH